MLRTAARINKIIPFSAVDGPGNRTAVFTQGCNFNCLYCHNPETIRLCENCGGCVDKCPVSALSLADGEVKWNPELCRECDNCIKICNRNSSPRVRLMSAADVISKIREYFPFIAGITISGGECTLWPGFMTELFDEAKRVGKTTFADSNGYVDFSAMPELMEVMDMAMIDLKSANPGEHKILTGKDNAPVIENICYLASIGKLFEIRTVVIPGLLDNRGAVELGSRLIAKYPGVRYKLIRYRPFGVRTDLSGPPSDDLLNELAALASDKGVSDVIIV